jgi:hypothetical protein
MWDVILDKKEGLRGKKGHGDWQIVISVKIKFILIIDYKDQGKAIICFKIDIDVERVDRKIEICIESYQPTV